MLAWCSAPSPGLSQPLVSASRLSNSRRYSGCIEASNSQELLTLPARMWCCVNAKKAAYHRTRWSRSKDQILEPSFTSYHPSKMFFLFSFSLVLIVNGVIDNINANSKWSGPQRGNDLNKEMSATVLGINLYLCKLKAPLWQCNSTTCSDEIKEIHTSGSLITWVTPVHPQVTSPALIPSANKL